MINSEVNASSVALAFFLIVLEAQRALPLKIKLKDPIRPLRCFLTSSSNPFLFHPLELKPMQNSEKEEDSVPNYLCFPLLFDFNSDIFWLTTSPVVYCPHSSKTTLLYPFIIITNRLLALKKKTKKEHVFSFGSNLKNTGGIAQW